MGLKLIALLSILVLAGCSSTPDTPEIITEPVETKIVQPILPSPIELEEPYWFVVSDKNLDDFLLRLEKDQGQVVFMAMTVSDYELMAYNMQEIKRYIKELGEVVVYYRKVTSK